MRCDTLGCYSLPQSDNPESCALFPRIINSKKKERKKERMEMGIFVCDVRVRDEGFAQTLIGWVRGLGGRWVVWVILEGGGMGIMGIMGCDGWRWMDIRRWMGEWE